MNVCVGAGASASARVRPPRPPRPHSAPSSPPTAHPPAVGAYFTKFALFVFVRSSYSHQRAYHNLLKQ